MKKYGLISFMLCLGGAIPAHEGLRIATYNIRREGKESQAKYSWNQRKDQVIDLIHSMSPDIIAFQEVVRSQFDDLIVAMPGYGFFGDPRGSKKRGLMQRIAMRCATNDYCPLFYNKKRLKCLSSGTFGLNPRNRVFRAWLPRICTWGLFEDKLTGSQFYVCNIHLENAKGADRIRAKQLKKVTNFIAENTQGLPVLVLGDFNTQLEGKVQRELARAGFVSIRHSAELIVGPAETRTGWENSQLKVIDHIVWKTESGRAMRYEVVASRPGVFPSDHRPVYADIVL